MRASIALITTALTAASTLLISGCSSTNKSSSQIVGSQSNSSSASPSAGSDDVNAAKRPLLKTDKHFDVQFENWASHDPKTNAVLLDGKYQILAINSAVFKLSPHAPEVSFYNSADALKSAEDWVASFQKDDSTMTGAIRYYDAHVTFPGSTYAKLTYCSDESQAFSKSLRNGRTDLTTPSANSYVFYSTALQKNSEGIWQTNSLTSQRGQCQP